MPDWDFGCFFMTFVNGVKGLSKLFPTVVFGGRTSHRGVCVSELIANSFLMPCVFVCAYFSHVGPYDCSVERGV